MKLVLPSIEYERSFREAIEEFRKETERKEIENRLIKRFDENSGFADFVEQLRGQAEGKYLPAGFVPSTEYWLVEDKKFIGKVNIRHRLNDNLLKTGGHIGYAIRPSERKKGYGTKILKLALPKAKKLGIKKALITCDEDNIGSRKIIEANGGIFENTMTTNEGIIKRRYWITI